jgi:hypothetical protein
LGVTYIHCVDIGIHVAVHHQSLTHILFPPLFSFPHQMGRRRWLLRIMGHPTRNPHQRCLDFTATGARSHRARGRPRQ